jgi:hypothetical protein
LRLNGFSGKTLIPTIDKSAQFPSVGVDLSAFAFFVSAKRRRQFAIANAIQIAF